MQRRKVTTPIVKRNHWFSKTLTVKVYVSNVDKRHFEEESPWTISKKFHIHSS